MKLIILGNGFDLHHKYKTSFYDFRTHLQNSDNSNDQLLISKIDQLLEVNKENPKTHLLWNGFESIIGNIMNTSNYKKHKVKNIPNLIEEFTQSFYYYLLKINKTVDNKINKILTEEFKDVSTVVSFNYTSFYSPYIKNENIDIFHIHGELSEGNLPIIGYYYPDYFGFLSSLDYSVKYNGKLIHKSALAYKQNEINLDDSIKKFTAKWRNSISEIVIIGYSFGSSDSHIYKILDDLMIKKTEGINIPSSQAKNIQLIKFKIYNYNKEESNQLIDKIKNELSKLKRRFSIKITGVGFTLKEKDIITFELKNY